MNYSNIIVFNRSTVLPSLRMIVRKAVFLGSVGIGGFTVLEGKENFGAFGFPDPEDPEDFPSECDELCCLELLLFDDEFVEEVDVCSEDCFCCC